MPPNEFIVGADSLHKIELDEMQRQMAVLAFAELALSRPGWDDSIRGIATKLDSTLSMYDHFKRVNADRVTGERSQLGPATVREDEEEVQRWLYGIAQGEPAPAGGFLKAFVQAALMADSNNYPILRPAIVQLKTRFPKYRLEGDIGGRT
jgi:hypothetical protein